MTKSHISQDIGDILRGMHFYEPGQTRKSLTCAYN